MRRRSVLATLAVGAVSGCSTRLPPFERSSPSERPSDAPALDDLPCPPADLVPEKTVCPAEHDDTPVAIRTNRRTTTRRDAGSVRFVLESETGSELRFNPHNPEVYRYSGDGYDRLARNSSGNGVTTVPPDGTDSWRLTDLPQFDRLSSGASLFAASVPTAGTMETDWVTCLTPFRLTDGRG